MSMMAMPLATAAGSSNSSAAARQELSELRIYFLPLLKIRAA
jgi:hypothetical protein